MMIVLAAALLWSLGASAASTQLDAGFLGMTPDKIHEELGEPHYIRVIDYGAGVRYAYFTPDEWARIADMAPLEQGDDVYLRTIGGMTWQYHFTYTPSYLEERFAPNYQVKEYIIYPEGTANLSQIAESLPEGQLLLHPDADACITQTEGGYGPVLMVNVPAASKELERDFRRFRERGDMCLELEIGFPNRITADSLTPDTIVSYIAFRAGVGQAQAGHPLNLQSVLR